VSASITVNAAAERRLVEIADLLWQVQKRFKRDDSPLTHEEIEAMKLASSDVHGILNPNPTPGLGSAPSAAVAEELKRIEMKELRAELLSLYAERARSRALPSNDLSKPHRSAWCESIELIQRQALIDSAIDSGGIMLDWLRDVRDLMVVELCVCTDFGVVEGAPQVKLVYLERVGGFTRHPPRPLNDVIDDLFRRAEDFSRAFPDPNARFLVVATATSSISMRRISASLKEED